MSSPLVTPSKFSYKCSCGQIFHKAHIRFLGCMVGFLFLFSGRRTCYTQFLHKKAILNLCTSLFCVLEAFKFVQGGIITYTQKFLFQQGGLHIHYLVCKVFTYFSLYLKTPLNTDHLALYPENVRANIYGHILK